MRHYRIVFASAVTKRPQTIVASKAELDDQIRMLNEHGVEVLKIEPYRLDWNEASNEEILKRYPRLAAHLICESLGYFTPGAAANALRHFKRHQPFYCEWYTHMAGGFDDAKVLEVGRLVLEKAIRRRHHHHGYMQEYQLARRLVDAELAGNGPIFASWF